jgi:hypothetical protein
MRLWCGCLFLLWPLWAQSPSEPIGPANVARLKVASIYDTRDSTGPLRPGGRPPRFETTPVYADGKLHLSTATGLVIAVSQPGDRGILFRFRQERAG